MKLLLPLFLTVLVYGNVKAQGYEIKETTQRVNNAKYPGVATKIYGKLEKVNEAWFDYLKDKGKVRRKRNYYSTTEFEEQETTLDTLTLFSRVDSKADSTISIWLAVSNDLSDNEFDKTIVQIEKLLLKFTRQYYVDVVQKDIDDAEKAVIYMSNSHQKSIKQGENLSDDLKSAKALKLKLETQLEETKFKIVVLDQKIIDNKVATDSLYLQVEKVKGVVDLHKEKMTEIE